MPDLDRLRTYVIGRINWHSGSGALSSRDEVLRGEAIVEELRDVLDVVNGRLPARAEGNRPWEKWEAFSRLYIQEKTAEAQQVLSQASDDELAAWERRFPKSEIIEAERRRRTDLQRSPVRTDEA